MSSPTPSPPPSARQTLAPEERERLKAINAQPRAEIKANRASAHLSGKQNDKEAIDIGDSAPLSRKMNRRQPQKQRKEEAALREAEVGAQEHKTYRNADPGPFGRSLDLNFVASQLRGTASQHRAGEEGTHGRDQESASVQQQGQQASLEHGNDYDNDDMVIDRNEASLGEGSVADANKNSSPAGLSPQPGRFSKRLKTKALREERGRRAQALPSSPSTDAGAPLPPQFEGPSVRETLRRSHRGDRRRSEQSHAPGRGFGGAGISGEQRAMRGQQAANAYAVAGYIPNPHPAYWNAPAPYHPPVAPHPFPGGCYGGPPPQFPHLGYTGPAPYSNLPRMPYAPMSPYAQPPPPPPITVYGQAPIIPYTSPPQPPVATPYGQAPMMPLPRPRQQPQRRRAATDSNAAQAPLPVFDAASMLRSMAPRQSTTATSAINDNQGTGASMERVSGENGGETIKVEEEDGQQQTISSYAAAFQMNPTAQPFVGANVKQESEEVRIKVEEEEQKEGK